MKHDAKKVVLTTKWAGQSETFLIQCDFARLSDGHPVAVLNWGPRMDLLGAQYAQLNPALLIESSRAGVAYEHIGTAIEIPKALNVHPEGLSDEAFRLGFFQLPE
jgi:hypothetical protein